MDKIDLGVIGKVVGVVVTAAFVVAKSSTIRGFLGYALSNRFLTVLPALFIALTVAAVVGGVIHGGSQCVV